MKYLNDDDFVNQYAETMKGHVIYLKNWLITCIIIVIGLAVGITGIWYLYQWALTQLK